MFVNISQLFVVDKNVRCLVIMFLYAASVFKWISRFFLLPKALREQAWCWCWFLNSTWIPRSTHDVMRGICNVILFVFIRTSQKAVDGYSFCWCDPKLWVLHYLSIFAAVCDRWYKLLFNYASLRTSFTAADDHCRRGFAKRSWRFIYTVWWPNSAT